MAQFLCFQNDGRDQFGIGQRTLSSDTPAVRAGGSEAASDQHVPETKPGNDGREPLQLLIDT
jgi:hypothetical protein